jgi:hypothetical protein
MRTKNGRQWDRRARIFGKKHSGTVDTALRHENRARPAVAHGQRGPVRKLWDRAVMDGKTEILEI